MHDIIPTNKNFREDKYVFSDNNKNKELNGKYEIIASNGQSSVENMFNTTNNTYWDSTRIYLDKLDDPVLASSGDSVLDSEACKGENYTPGSCIHRYPSNSNNGITGYTKYYSNDNEDNVVMNKVNTKINGETITIILPNPYYIYEINMEFIEGHSPKRYFVYAYDEEIKKYNLLGLKLNMSYKKTQENLPFYPNKKYKKIVILFNATTNETLKISKLQLKGDKTLKTAHESKYTMRNIEALSNMNKKVRFADTKYIYEYGKNNNIYSELLIPLGLTSLIFFVYLNKKI